MGCQWYRRGSIATASSFHQQAFDSAYPSSEVVFILSTETPIPLLGNDLHAELTLLVAAWGVDLDGVDDGRKLND
jgi:hypothetical protein